MSSTINELPAVKPIHSKDSKFEFKDWPAPDAVGGWVEIIINEVVYTTTVSASGKYNFSLPDGWEDGMHVVQIVTVDPAGSRSSPSLFVLDIDTKPPAAPKIMRIVDNSGSDDHYLTPGDEIADKTPVLSGSAEPGSTVTIYDGATVLGTATANKLGVWEREVTLAKGSHTITVKATDETGNTGAASSPYIIKVADAITVVGLDDQSNTAETQAMPEPYKAVGGSSLSPQKENTIKLTDIEAGAGEVGSLVQIVLDNNVYTTHVRADGKWSWSSEVLTDGLHVLQVRLLDASLNWGESTQIIYQIDAASPEKPIIMNALDDVGGMHNLSPGDFTNDNMPTFSGIAQPGSKVTLYDGGAVVIGTAIALADGTWSFTPSIGLTEGAHFISAEYTDSFGRVSPKSDAFKLEIDTNTPVTPTLELVYDDEGRLTGAVESGKATDDKTPTFSGSAELGSIVRIWSGSTLLGTTTVSKLGKWSFTPSPALVDGNYDIQVDAISKGGNASPKTPVFDLVIDSTLMQPVEIGDVFADNVSGVTSSIPDGGVTNDTTPVVSGVGNDGDIVYLYVDGATSPIGSATVVGGKWSITPTTPLSEKAHELTVRAKDPSTDKWAPVSQPRDVVIDITAPDKPAPAIVIDDQGDVTGPVGSDGVTDDKRPEFKGGGVDEGDTVEVVVKDDKGNPVFVGTQVVDASGNWSITPPTDLADGEYQIVVGVTDPAGNKSTPSDPVKIIVDTQKPADLNNVQLTDDVGVIQGPILDGMSTDDTKPTFSGTGVNGTKVAVIIDGVEVARVEVKNGAWSYTPVTALSEAAHTISAIPVSAAGVKGNATTPINFTIDTTAPVTGTFDGVYYDAGQYGPLPEGKVDLSKPTNDNTLIMRGTGGEDGNTVFIYGSTGTGELLGSTTVIDGKWEFTTGVLEDRSLNDNGKWYDFHVVLQDPAGNQLNVSTNYKVEVDTVAPTKPVIPGINSVFAINELSDEEVTNLMSMSINDIVTKGENNLFIDNGKAQLMVNGEKGDVLNIADILPEGAETASWQQATGTVTVAGVQYNVYENNANNVELLVQQGIETHH